MEIGRNEWKAMDKPHSLIKWKPKISYTNQQLIDYSYYWFDIDEKLKIGWDNAPHHPEITTFHHHKHYFDHIEESSEKSFLEVLKFICVVLIDE